MSKRGRRTITFGIDRLDWLKAKAEREGGCSVDAILRKLIDSEREREENIKVIP